MNIGELSRRTGVTAETIRYYERVGVLPRPARGGGGYRRYGAADEERLAFVRRARDLGFSLGEVRELLSLADDPARPCADVDQLARVHLAQVEAKLAQLAGLRSELVRVIGQCRGGLAVADCRILRTLASGRGTTVAEAPSA
jgi:Cu(I)-responsive transcriptional regulator